CASRVRRAWKPATVRNVRRQDRAEYEHEGYGVSKTGSEPKMPLCVCKCAGGPCVDTGNGPKCQNNGQTGCSSDSDCNGNKECCNGVCSPNCSPCDSVTCLAGDETCVETPEPHCECTSSVYNCLVSPCSVTPCDNHPAAEC
ncbi:hypothetical protein BaRGS_00038867, partial [Batillaria attramentaria]